MRNVNICVSVDFHRSFIYFSRISESKLVVIKLLVPTVL